MKYILNYHFLDWISFILYFLFFCIEIVYNLKNLHKRQIFIFYFKYFIHVVAVLVYWPKYYFIKIFTILYFDNFKMTKNKINFKFLTILNTRNRFIRGKRTILFIRKFPWLYHISFLYSFLCRHKIYVDLYLFYFESVMLYYCLIISLKYVELKMKFNILK